MIGHMFPYALWKLRDSSLPKNYKLLTRPNFQTTWSWVYKHNQKYPDIWDCKMWNFKFTMM